MKRTALIVAGGKGLRMGGDFPKQYMRIGGMPVLMRTIEAFHRFDCSMEIIVVIPSDHRDYWTRLCEEESFAIPHTVVNGGKERYDSVRNGLEWVAEDTLVAVHDGVRPFVTDALLDRCFQGAEQYGAVLPVVEVIDTLREITPNGSVTVDRAKYRQVQTPQVFRSSLLKAAYAIPIVGKVTDDASVVEAYGHPVEMVAGLRENIKITTPFDLLIAESLTHP